MIPLESFSSEQDSTDAEGKATRRGARTRAERPAEVRRQLNAGELDTGNLVEALVVDSGERLAADQPAVGAESLQ